MLTASERGRPVGLNQVGTKHLFAISDVGVNMRQACDELYRQVDEWLTMWA
jgi:hypothetical protein